MQVSSIVRLEPPATYRVSSVPGTPPRAFFVGRSEVVASAAERLRRLREPDFDPASAVVLEEGVPLAGHARADAVVRRHVSDHVVATVSNPEPGFLVLLDAWYPGWEATLDGRPAPVLRANHAFRAVALREAGEHTVEFHYVPPSVRTGFFLSAAGLALLTAMSSLQWRLRAHRR